MGVSWGFLPSGIRKYDLNFEVSKWHLFPTEMVITISVKKANLQQPHPTSQEMEAIHPSEETSDL